MVTNNVTSVEAISRGWVSVLILEIKRRSRSSVFFKFIKRSWSRQVHQTSFFYLIFLDKLLGTFWPITKPFLRLSSFQELDQVKCWPVLRFCILRTKKSWDQYKKPSLEPPERSICKDPTLVISRRKPIRFCSHWFFLQVLTLLHSLTCISIRSIYCPQGSLVCSALGVYDVECCVRQRRRLGARPSGRLVERCVCLYVVNRH